MAIQETSHLAIERHRIIRDALRREGVVRNAELKELLGVSVVTVRADLRELEKEGECRLIWGGAVSVQSPVQPESVLAERGHLHVEEKRRIGAYAAELIQSGQTIFVDAGSTTVELVRQLPDGIENLRLVTPALNVAMAASVYPEVEVIIPGGIIRNLTGSLVGSQTTEGLAMFNADWFFLATGGISAEVGVTTGNLLEAEVKKSMHRRARKCCVVTDSSKFGHVLSLLVASLSTVDMIVTDNGLSVENSNAIKAYDVELVCI